MKQQKVNFSGVPRQGILGTLLRLPLNLIPKDVKMPILQGQLKGKKWIVGSSQHGCWLGSYEYEKQSFFAKTIKQGSVVYDIGAHAGFYTLLASELVGEKGKVIAFEPLPVNIRYLKEHVRLNKCENVMVIEAAVSEKREITSFEKGLNSFVGHMSEKGSLKVESVYLDDLESKKEIPPPDYMKIDVEGSEMQVLSGAKSILSNYHPTILLATHGKDIHKLCCNYLLKFGYELSAVNNNQEIDETDELLAFKKK